MCLEEVAAGRVGMGARDRRQEAGRQGKMEQPKKEQPLECGKCGGKTGEQEGSFRGWNFCYVHLATELVDHLSNCPPFFTFTKINASFPVLPAAPSPKSTSTMLWRDVTLPFSALWCMYFCVEL